MFATRKQIDLAIRLGIRTGKIQPFEARAWEGKLAQYTVEEVSAAIKAMNQKLGYNPRFTAATPTQLRYIAHLEHDALGRVETGPQSRLSYAEADARIKYLKASAPTQKTMVTAEASSNVIDIFTKKAV